MKSIGFFACSNGFGHYKRISEIASLLSNDFDITIYASYFQIKKLGLVENCKHVELKLDNIRWDKTISESNINFGTYIKGVEEYKDLLTKHDYIVSDNIVGVLEHRPDAILLGSFLWKDVYRAKFGSNVLSDYDSNLLQKHNPLLITNKYAETGGVVLYGNKVQFGFGCKATSYTEFKVDKVLTLEPSLNYLDSYANFFKGLNINATKDFSLTKNIVIMSRPGLGIITHCVEHHIPLIALYDNRDSIEIVKLAKKVQQLNIGFHQNVKSNFDYSKFSIYKDNSIYRYNHFEKDGYIKIAGYLKSKL